MSKMYNTVPSGILRIFDEYTAYCVDEACAYIRYMMEIEKQEPVFTQKASSSNKSFSDIYKKYDK